MLESMVLVQVLGLLWSVQVVETNLEVPLAKSVGLVQVVVDGVLGLVKGVLLASVTVPSIPSVSTIPTSIAITATVPAMSVSASVSTKTISPVTVSAMSETATVSAEGDSVSETTVRITIASIVPLATITFLLITFLSRFIAMMVVFVIVVLVVLFQVMPVVFIVLVGPCHSNQKSDAQDQSPHLENLVYTDGITDRF